jgi:hypothetical protein
VRNRHGRRPAGGTARHGIGAAVAAGAAAAALCIGAPLRAQDAPARPDFLGLTQPRAAVLLLGTFHFDYPDLDVEKPGHRVDVATLELQRQIDEVVERLAAYRPTRIAVEARVERQGRLDSLYHAYLDGRWELGRSEVYQLGFRLARRLGHDRVWAVDTERHDLFVDLARSSLEPRSAELFATDSAWRGRFRALSAWEDSTWAAGGGTLRELFLRKNDPDRIRVGHMAYSVGFFRFDGEEGGYLGADFVSGWYNRNLRIFRNLQRITRGPEERLLLIIGSGHLPILRFVVEHSPEYVLEEVGDYLRLTAPTAVP